MNNTEQINIDPEMRKEVTEDFPESLNMLRNKRYNLRPRPSRRNPKYTL